VEDPSVGPSDEEGGGEPAREDGRGDRTVGVSPQHREKYARTYLFLGDWPRE